MNEDLHVGVALHAAAPVPVEIVPAVEARPRIGAEQLAYARVLDGGMKLGLLFLTATFVVYVTGVLPPHVPVDELSRYWSLPVKELLAATDMHPGWSWLRLVHKGDLLNLVGVAFLAGVTIICYAGIIPTFFRKKDRAYAWISVAEVLVLALAASGLLNAGAH